MKQVSLVYEAWRILKSPMDGGGSSTMTAICCAGGATPPCDGGGSRSPSPRRGRERYPSPSSSERLHLADLDETVSSRNVESTFSKFGKLSDVWVASYPPYFGFVVFENGDDAVDAIKSMKSGYIGDCRVRVSVALPRGSRRSPRPYRGGGGGYGSRRSPLPRRNDYPRRLRSPAPRKRDYSTSRSRSPIGGRHPHSPIADTVSD
uniref:RRM domain-containing protein n=1 Tax=Panagrolaimus davidi TaxID=227884 RepID=A0A914R1K1_9BILA